MNSVNLANKGSIWENNWYYYTSDTPPSETSLEIDIEGLSCSGESLSSFGIAVRVTKIATIVFLSLLILPIPVIVLGGGYGFVKKCYYEISNNIAIHRVEKHIRPCRSPAFLNEESTVVNNTAYKMQNAIQVKSGFPNVSLSCWLSVTLQLMNIRPFLYDIRDEENYNDFPHQKEAITMMLKLLEKSRKGQNITPNEIVNLRKILNKARPSSFAETGLEALSIVKIFELMKMNSCQQVLLLFGQNEQDFNETLEVCLKYNPEGDSPPINGYPPYKFDTIAPEVIYVEVREEKLVFPLTTHAEMADGTTYDYELAAIAVLMPGGIAHYYAYINEGDSKNPYWVKYNDSVVTEDVKLTLSESDIVNHGYTFVYRKTQDALS